METGAAEALEDAWTQTTTPSAPPSPGEVHLWPVRVIARPNWHDLLSPAEREQTARFAVEHARLTFVTSRGAQQHVLGHYLQSPPGSVRVDRGCAHCGHASHGRPTLTGPAGTLDFSVSHTARWVLIAVASEGITGVDIESGGSARDFGGLARQILTPAELAQYSTTDSAQKVAWLIRAWARKEAAMKVSGLGMRATPSQLNITGSAAVASDIPGWPSSPVHLYDLPSLGDHHAALASTEKIITFTVCTLPSLA
jgi:4'-phosphopantetheinyl transferase